jgi:hypothetical protein
MAFLMTPNVSEDSDLSCDQFHQIHWQGRGGAELRLSRNGTHFPILLLYRPGLRLFVIEVRGAGNVIDGLIFGSIVTVAYQERIHRGISMPAKCMTEEECG